MTEAISFHQILYKYLIFITFMIPCDVCYFPTYSLRLIAYGQQADNREDDRSRSGLGRTGQ
ncbi:hypothetical protein MPL3356_200081 [Mesorhizobium plurifarium]|uniref:Uncharacterized protein n=1 Tax=Mesorhizobium plurifarium TaxID=69974 RepID=A0A090DJE4_MESPL|nr:hypothetical protein MPL3356_200081 [Mesorhizobium plurifarium]